MLADFTSWFNKKQFLPIVAASIVLPAALAAPAGAFTTVFSDDFNRTSPASGFVGNGGTLSAPSGYTNTWNTTVTAGDGGAQINGSQLVLTNDRGGANAKGSVYVSRSTSDFGSPYRSTLSSNTDTVSWTFNMRQIRPNPGGFNANGYGVAFVLGASSDDFLTANGYAVVVGSGANPEPVRLVRFTSGLDLNANLTNVVSGVPILFANNQNNDYLSLQVDYNPASNTWNLYGRNDGASSFADPLSGSLTGLGSATDSTYVNSSLDFTGALWKYNTAANQTASFDNVKVRVAPVPPQFLGTALMAVWGLWQTRRKQANLSRLSAAAKAKVS
jgi:trimeric autotransporter adhesin